MCQRVWLMFLCICSCKNVVGVGVGVGVFACAVDFVCVFPGVRVYVWIV